MSQQLGIEPGEARKFIDAYFEKYAGVRAFIDATLEQTRRDQKVKTLFGRIRPIPDINSKNATQRGFAERTAVNTPLQGTAADLIKLAMIRIDEEIRKRGLKSRMTLQVHDELVFEVPENEVDADEAAGAGAHGAGACARGSAAGGNRSGTKLAGHGVAKRSAVNDTSESEENIPAFRFHHSDILVRTILASAVFVVDSSRMTTIFDSCGGSLMSAAPSPAFEETPQRRFPRHPINVPLDLIALRSGVPENLPGRCTDISEGGVGAVVAGELAAGQQVAVELRLPNVGVRFGRARWFVISPGSAAGLSS